ncbi:MAG TPA: pyruvate kinase [Candidatus Eisenbacteria bacterium]|nr:pyruvate kinase [Candidatus Eisenbacteria bacterium]
MTPGTTIDQAAKHPAGVSGRSPRKGPGSPRAPRSDSALVLRAVAQQLARLEDHLRDVEAKLHPVLSKVHPEWVESARNLVHYAALRQHDLREVQLLLQQHGLSSLGRSESFVMASLLAVRMRVAESLLASGTVESSELGTIATRSGAALSGPTAEFLLHAHTHDALGPKPEGRHVYVMVTAPGVAEADAAWLARMLRAGMNVLRINTVHEGPAEWTRILDALAVARRETGRECRVLMDLAGPKIRTGSIAEETRVATWKLRRNHLGRLLEPATVVLRPAVREDATAEGPMLILDDGWFAQLRCGDVLRFRDTRDKRRALVIRRIAGGEAVAEVRQRAYVIEKTRFAHERRGRLLRHGFVRIGGASKASLPLEAGDLLVVTPRDVQGRGARRNARGRVLEPALVSCTLPEALAGVAIGHRVLFDDGAIEGVVERMKGGDVYVRVRHTSRPTAKLRAEKGINLPDSPMPVPALGADDCEHLRFVARHADLVGLSFVRTPADVHALHEALDTLLPRRDLGIVLKIETKAGFENLPHILLEAMRRPPLAVMIARGDLAIELGFERLAEVQEEILWLCEASHVPAIWATQVLDTLARTGVPSRAEVTDAAASVAAECVMLNKGAHMEQALRALVDILHRMERHHYKKRSIFRRLRVSALPEGATSGSVRRPQSPPPG